MSLRATCASVLLATLLCGCGKPVPADKSDYVGEWRSKEMYLLILADGTVSYKRLKGGGQVSVNGPIREFKGDNFVVGVPLLTTTFVVSKPPYTDGGKWHMVVDGIDLTKTR